MSIIVTPLSIIFLKKFMNVLFREISPDFLITQNTILLLEDIFDRTKPNPKKKNIVAYFLACMKTNALLKNVKAFPTITDFSFMQVLE